jgi:hypothetical protein
MYNTNALLIVSMPFILASFIGLVVALVNAISNHDVLGVLLVAVLAVGILIATDKLIMRCVATPAMPADTPADTSSVFPSNIEFIESPYSGNVMKHLRYLSLCGIDSFLRGYMPVSTHGSMTIHPACKELFVHDDWNIFGRNAAIQRANDLRAVCEKTVFYVDLGWSTEMKHALAYCKQRMLPYEVRTIDVHKIASLRSPLLSQDFIQTVLDGQDYEEFLHSSSMQED